MSKNKKKSKYICSHCKRQILPSDKYCIYCGKDISKQVVCPKCHKVILDTDNFCIYCGNDVKNITKCQKCGKTIIGTDKYCIYCGEKTGVIDLSYARINNISNEIEQEESDNVASDYENNEQLDSQREEKHGDDNNNTDKPSENYKLFTILGCVLLVLICSLTILFTRKINITYVNDEGTSNTNPTVYKFTDFKVQLKDISKKGYDFLGWYMYKNDEEFTLYSLGVDLLFGGDLTLYAAFEPIEYKITYDANGGTNYNNNPQTYTIGTYAYLFEPTKNGYIFEGWYDDSGNQILVIDGSQKTGNLKLTAKWRKDYNGEYSYKSSTYSQSAIGSITINGDNVKVRDYPSATYGNKIGLVHKGYSYDVYEIEQNENYTWYKIGDSMWIPDNGSWLSYNRSTNNNCVATIKILADSMKIRSAATAAVDNKISLAKKDDIYDVYQIIYNEGYTWYKIGENAWIGDDGNWVITLQSHYGYDVQTSYHALLVNIDELSLASSPSTSSDYYYEYSVGDVIYFGNGNSSIESVYVDGYTWYHITNVAYAIDNKGNYIYSGEGWIPDENGSWVTFIQ